MKTKKLLGSGSTQPGQMVRRFWRSSTFITLALFIAISFVIANQKSPSNTAYADPFIPACQPEGFLFQYNNTSPPNSPPTTVDSVDLITNSLTRETNSFATNTINAVGYNVSDDFIYGWDNKATPTNLVRVHSDFQTADPITTISGDPLPSVGIIAAGDVDNNGQYWFANPFHWYRLDLSTSPNPTYTAATGTGQIYGGPGNGPPQYLGPDVGAISQPLDFAYVPPSFLNDNRDGLYTIVVNKSDPNPANHFTELYRFNISNPANPQWEVIGPIPQMDTTAGVAGALYADALGTLYAGSNDGRLWHVVIGNAGLGINLQAIGPTTGDPAQGNDGARCANAWPPADFGDAPSSYATTITDIGPLHLIGNFNVVDSTAPLMLGTKIDMETDGFPSVLADGDDLNHNPGPPLNDEDAVQHIVAPATPEDLTVPVTVTNNDAVNPATLVGWIDSNNDGDFFDEAKVIQTIPNQSGTATYELTFTGLDFSGGVNTFARFRVFQGTGLSDDQTNPAGFDSAFQLGEVEDHLVQVGSFSTRKTSTPASGSTVAPGQEITYTLQITNTGSTDLINLTVHDDLTDVLDDATLEGTPMVNPGSAGTATVIDNMLQFDGDIPTGQSATLTYKVKIKPATQLANHAIRNLVIAGHSNCHPQMQDGQRVFNGNSDCQTVHHIDAGLANTGQSHLLLVITAFVLITSAVILVRSSRLGAYAAAGRP